MNKPNIPESKEAKVHGATAPSPPRSGKVKSWHLERQAIVYVRQSSPQQVQENKESAARQYALVNRALELGWQADQVIVIDEDQGQSGASADGRMGFQRLLAEVSLDHVGIILGLEMSRLARSCKDWHQLLEVCGIFRTVLADQDGLYDPTDYNDRLLLGLKGTMSEAELHVLRGRMYQGMLNKARRGELYMLPPFGYIKSNSGEFALDPDEQVQSTVRLIFDQFGRLGTMRSVHRYLVENGIRVGIRPHRGPMRGQLEWRWPSKDVVYRVLWDPLYAGMYRFGLHQTDPRCKKAGQPGSGRVAKSPEEYLALIPDRCPAYITQERYEANQKRLANNRMRTESQGAARNGSSLLAGLLRCGRCGRRMAVLYDGKKRRLSYLCNQDLSDGRGRLCQSLSGRKLDDFIATQVLIALQPAALELSLAAATDVEKERGRLEEVWQQRLERLRYQADRAERQYEAVEPENRLVARNLERRWEQALKEVGQLEHEYARYRQAQPVLLSSSERESIRALAQDLPAVWHAETTTAIDRQRIIRLVVQSIQVEVLNKTNQVRVTIFWAGGHITEHLFERSVQRYEQVANHTELVQRVRDLRSAGLSFAGIAGKLNEESFRSPKGHSFTTQMVMGIWRRLKGNSRKRAKAAEQALCDNEWTASDLAKRLKISKGAVFAWIHRGWITYRRLPGYRGSLLCWADREELQRLERLRDAPRGWWDAPLPPSLTTPTKVIDGSRKAKANRKTP